MTKMFLIIAIGAACILAAVLVLLNPGEPLEDNDRFDFATVEYKELVGEKRFYIQLDSAQQVLSLEQQNMSLNQLFSILGYIHNEEIHFDTESVAQRVSSIRVPYVFTKTVGFESQLASVTRSSPFDFRKKPDGSYVIVER